MNSQPVQPTPPPNQSPSGKKASPLDFQAQLDSLMSSAKQNPQIVLLLSKIKALWSIYGYRVKLSLGIVLVLVIIILGIRFGLDLAGLNRPDDPIAPEIPDPTPTVINRPPTQLMELREEISKFSILLPDPAPPSVDQEISLE